MKHIAFVALLAALVVLLALPAEAQNWNRVNPSTMTAGFYTRINTTKAYVLSTNDTSATENLAWVRELEYYVVFNDSVNVITRFEYKSNPSASWTAVKFDTLNHTGGGTVTGSTYRTVALKAPTSDLLGNLSGQLRVIHIFAATVIGVTTPTYSDQWRWKP